jgi:hypothetical protein
MEVFFTIEVGGCLFQSFFNGTCIATQVYVIAGIEIKARVAVDGSTVNCQGTLVKGSKGAIY